MRNEKDLNLEETEKKEHHSSKKKGILTGVIVGGVVALSLGLGIGMGISKVPSYDLLKNQLFQEYGKIKLSQNKAKEGQFVEVEIELEEKYKLIRLFYTLEDDTKEYEISMTDGVKYCFQMPKGDVTICAEVEELILVATSIDDIVTNVYVEEGTKLSEVLSQNFGEITEFNSCGWFADENYTYVADLEQEIISDISIYTRKATLINKQGQEMIGFISNDDGTCSAIGVGNITTGEIVLPIKSPDGDVVTSVAEEAFDEDSELSYFVTSLTLPTSITHLKEHSFYDMYNLEFVNFPNTLTELPSWLFESSWNCIEKIILPETITKLGSGTFAQCYNLTEIKLPANLEIIDEYLFTDCYSLSSIEIPASVTSIGEDAFSFCHSLAEVYNYSDLIITLGTEDSSDNGALGQYAKVVYNKTDLTGEKPASRIKVIDNIQYYVYEDEFIALSSSISKNKLTDIKLDFHTTEINSYAFNNCRNLSKIIIPENVNIIGKNSFQNCVNLTTITIPSTVTTIEVNAFASCNALVEVYNYSDLIITKGTTNYNDNGYLGQYAKVVYNKSDLTGGKPETRIQTINNVKYYVYGNDFIALTPTSRDITNIMLDSRTTEIGDNAFYACKSLISVTQGDNIKIIGNDAFGNCRKMNKLNLSKALTIINDAAFYNCESLEEIIIPSNLISLGSYAFGSCKNLKKISFSEDSKLVNLSGSVFNSCSSLLNIIIPSGITVINSSTFNYCSSLKSISFLGEITHIGSSAFRECEQLTSITIPSTVTGIGNSAFQNCKGLTEINYNAISCSNFSIKNNIFTNAGQNGDGITVNIGTEVKSIPSSLFYSTETTSSVPKITKIVFAEGSQCETINSYAFANCSYLSEINIPSSITKISSFLFKNCTNLKEATVESNITYYGLASTGLASEITQYCATIYVLSSLTGSIDNLDNYYTKSETTVTRNGKDYYVYTRK